MTLPEEVQKRWPFVWDSGNNTWIAEALSKDEMPNNIQLLSNGYYCCKIYSELVITFFEPTPESLAPFMGRFMNLVANKEAEYYGDPYESIEIGIYDLNDIRAWKVHKGI